MFLEGTMKQLIRLPTLAFLYGAAIATLASGLIGKTASASVEVEILARSGDLVPGRPEQGVLRIRHIGSAVPELDGSVVFTAEVEDSNGFASTGVWRRAPNGTFTRVVSRGDDALDFGAFSEVIEGVDVETLAVLADGRVAFDASLGGAPPGPFALFLSSFGAPAGTVVAVADQPANGSGTGAEYRFFTGVAGSGPNHLMYSGVTRVLPSTDERGNVWSSPGGNGLDTAYFPTVISGTHFVWSPRVLVTSERPGEAVDVIGDGALQTVGTPVSPTVPAWVTTDRFFNQRAEIFGPEPAPGIPGSEVDEVLDVATNKSGRSVLSVRLLTGGGSDVALYVGPSGQGVPLLNATSGAVEGFFLTSGPPRLRMGVTGPGTGGLEFDAFGEVAIADNGRIAFTAHVFDPSESGSSQEVPGIWMEGESGFELVAFKRLPLRLGREFTAPVQFVGDELNFDAQGRLLTTVELNDAADTSLLIRVRAFDPRRPIVRVNGPQRRTVSRASMNLRGRVRAELPVERVELRSTAQNRFRSAKGLETWRARVRLREGRNVIRIRATDVENNRSQIQRVIITRLVREG